MNGASTIRNGDDSSVALLLDDVHHDRSRVADGIIIDYDNNTRPLADWPSTPPMNANDDDDDDDVDALLRLTVVSTTPTSNDGGGFSSGDIRAPPPPPPPPPPSWEWQASTPLMTPLTTHGGVFAPSPMTQTPLTTGWGFTPTFLSPATPSATPGNLFQTVQNAWQEDAVLANDNDGSAAAFADTTDTAAAALSVASAKVAADTNGGTGTSSNEEQMDYPEADNDQHDDFFLSAMTVQDVSTTMELDGASDDDDYDEEASCYYTRRAHEEKRRRRDHRRLQLLRNPRRPPTEWTHRSVSSLVHGFRSAAPILDAELTAQFEKICEEGSAAPSLMSPGLLSPSHAASTPAAILPRRAVSTDSSQAASSFVTPVSSFVMGIQIVPPSNSWNPAPRAPLPPCPRRGSARRMTEEAVAAAPSLAPTFGQLTLTGTGTGGSSRLSRGGGALPPAARGGIGVGTGSIVGGGGGLGSANIGGGEEVNHDEDWNDLLDSVESSTGVTNDNGGTGINNGTDDVLGPMLLRSNRPLMGPPGGNAGSGGTFASAANVAAARAVVADSPLVATSHYSEGARRSLLGGGSSGSGGIGGGAPLNMARIGGGIGGGIGRIGIGGGGIGGIGRINGGIRGRTKKDGGPNIVLALLGRETVGRSSSPLLSSSSFRSYSLSTSARRRRRSDSGATHENYHDHPPPISHRTTHLDRLFALGGRTLHSAFDNSSNGIISEVESLREAVVACRPSDQGDRREDRRKRVESLVFGLIPRLVEDPQGRRQQQRDNGAVTTARATAEEIVARRRYHGGKGKIGLERDVFVLAGGVELFLQVIRNAGYESYSPRCANEAMAALCDLLWSSTSMVRDIVFAGDASLLPDLFALLAHDAFFESAAATIEAILQSRVTSEVDGGSTHGDDDAFRTAYDFAIAEQSSSTTSSAFSLADVPNLYDLWGNFTPRQLATFSRILGLLLVDPEDRAFLLERSSILASNFILRNRRDRAARAGRDATTEVNRALVLGDLVLVRRLLCILRVTNYAPRAAGEEEVGPSAGQIVRHPFVKDTMIMLGFTEITNWGAIETLDTLAREALDRGEYKGEGTADGDDNNSNGASHPRPEHLCDIGSIGNMLTNLSEYLSTSLGDDSVAYLQHLRQFIHAARDAGVSLGRPNASASQIFSAERLHVDVTVDESRENSLDGPNHNNFVASKSAADDLQFNAMFLAPFEYEVVFVICTLLGGRRKVDAQRTFAQCGLVSVLEDMFECLNWGGVSRKDPDPRLLYLRTVGNFCERESDNYTLKLLLLSTEEREILSDNDYDLNSIVSVRPGLLSKIMSAFIKESDLGCRSWLASCIQSFLRGSSERAKIFVAQKLLDHLVETITSSRLHCAGSLQASFDFLGELCKGNHGVLRMLLELLNEARFQRLMSVATENLMDSNVFIRSLVIGVQRLLDDRRNASSESSRGRYLDKREYEKEPLITSLVSDYRRGYLTHSWLDLPSNEASVDKVKDGVVNASTRASPSRTKFNNHMESVDWFSPLALLNHDKDVQIDDIARTSGSIGADCTRWIFDSPHSSTEACNDAVDIDRLVYFLSVNRSKFFYELLNTVSLKTITHENVSIVKSVIILSIFAHRDNQLGKLLDDLRAMSCQECGAGASVSTANKNTTQIQKGMETRQQNRREHTIAKYNVQNNFRELLWFWSQYHMNRGGDRVSLEFYSHIRFEEFNHVVSLLIARDGSPTSLAAEYTDPFSPYQFAPRV